MITDLISNLQNILKKAEKHEEISKKNHELCNTIKQLRNDVENLQKANVQLMKLLFEEPKYKNLSHQEMIDFFEKNIKTKNESEG